MKIHYVLFTVILLLNSRDGYKLKNRDGYIKMKMILMNIPRLCAMSKDFSEEEKAKDGILNHKIFSFFH